MELGLKGRAVIVAGSSEGMGRSAAEAFAAEGARVAICARTEAKIQQAAQEIRAKHKAEVFAMALDVSQAEAVKKFVAAVAEKFGGVDVCVANAAGPPSRNFFTATNDDWHKAFEMNFMSVVHFAREVIPWMQKKKWGRFLTLTSVSVKQPIPDLILSNAVRAGVVGLVKSMANEFGKDGITVNNVGPGYTATERLKSLAATRALAAGLKPEDMYDKWSADTPLKRIATPEEVADAMVWLASERASYITGQTLLVDGGSYRGV
ncbi:MAG TPA: SDR family oxidoreductase [Terriglobales bacterium]|jgi:3-oxoacyl-[acyl-carrier protein] reductase|nr:SDR family oxidoreductase [Terriglobales bacterium]